MTTKQSNKQINNHANKRTNRQTTTINEQYTCNKQQTTNNMLLSGAPCWFSCSGAVGCVPCVLLLSVGELRRWTLRENIH